MPTSLVPPKQPTPHARLRATPSRSLYAAALATTALWFCPAPLATATATRALTVYAVASAAQFVDHADDRARGAARNPFHADTGALVPATNAKEKGKGPYPGDDALYSFKLYRSPTLDQRVGTATLTCVYNFNQQALCEADIQVSDGTLFAAGPADFTSPIVTLAITGGSGAYLGAHGQLTTGPVSSPKAKNEERFDFLITQPR